MRFWLDPFSMPIAKNGIALPPRETISIGAGLDAQDDPANDATIIKRRQEVSLAALGADYTIASTGERILCITAISGSSGTMLLPASPSVGDSYLIKDAHGHISGSHTVVLDGNGHEVDGNDTITIGDAYFAIRVVFMDGGWAVVAYFRPSLMA